MTPDGEDGLNYLCADYKAYFTHIARPMKIMARLLRKRRFADVTMQISAVEKEALLSAATDPRTHDKRPSC